jgi:Tfp pilus assembly protein PilX
MPEEKGSALISVILVVLVLTMVGVASLFFMTTEDRISGVTKMEKTSFYAAEIGLREAERTIRNQFAISTNALNALLTYNSGAADEHKTFEVPGGGYNPARVLSTPTDVVIAHTDPITQAAIPAGEMRGIQIVTSEGFVSTYSVYVRNDAEDTSLSPTVDIGGKINIISVGQVASPSGQIVRKVLEEQIFAGIGGGLGSGQKGLNTGSTGSVGVE